MEFVVVEDKNCHKLVQIGEKYKIIAYFKNDGIAPLMAEDYCDFLNDKYLDKEINAEWPEINRYRRIVYHIEQLQLLTSDKRIFWNEHGTGVRGFD